MLEGKCSACGLVHAAVGVLIRGHELEILGRFLECPEGWRIRSDVLEAHPELQTVFVRDRAAWATLTASIQTVKESGVPSRYFGGSILLCREHWQLAPKRTREQILKERAEVRNENAGHAKRRNNQDERSGGAPGRDSQGEHAAAPGMADPGQICEDRRHAESVFGLATLEIKNP